MRNIFLVLFLFFGKSLVYADFMISAVLPNTIDDKNLEYIEVINLSKEPLSLSGYYLEDKSSKRYEILDDTNLSYKDRKKFYRLETKIILNNTNEEVYLYDSFGVLLDKVEYKTSNKGEEIVFVDDDFIDQKNNEIVKGSLSGVILTYVPDIQYSFQIPTYLIEYEDIKSEYICDNSKDECKVNFDLRTSFDDNYRESDYNCYISFLSLGSLYTEQTCNPNTFVFSDPETLVNFKIEDKNDSSNYKETSIKIIKVSTSGSSGGSSSSYISNSIDIKAPEIIIQSGLDENNNCKKIDCNLNLKYEPKNSKEACLWDFGSKASFSPGTDKKCNPGYVKYFAGEYSVKLKVYEAGNESNYKESYLSFKNLEKTVDTKYFYDTDYEIKSIIKLQGRIGKTKVLKGNYLSCYDTKLCLVNFDGRDSYSLDKSKLSFRWSVENIISGKSASFEYRDGDLVKDNPNTFKFGLGEYKISLEIKDAFGKTDLDEFFLKVIDEKKEDFLEEYNLFEDEEIISIDSEYKFLEISKALPNPRGTDHDEWIEIKNTGKKSINLKNCEIDDILNGGSKSYKIKNDLILNPSKKLRFYKFDTRISLNNTGEEQVNILCDGNLIDSLSWDFSVKEGLEITKELLSIKSQKVKIIKAIDGDTFLIELKNKKQIKLRLIGVDTPETKHPRKALEYYGIEAYNYSKKLEGKTIKLEIEETNYMDKYGRLLGYLVFDDGNLYNKLLLDYGYARAYLKYDFLYYEDFKKSENKAKKSKLGLWGDKKAIEEIKDLEKQEKILEKEEKDKIESLKDDDSDKIPDFIESINHENKSKKEIYKSFVNKSFSQKISKLKTGLKISGKTMPYSRLVFKIEVKKESSFLDLFIDKSFANDIKYYESFSDKDGIYEKIIDDLSIGNIEISSLLIDLYDNKFEIKEKKQVYLDKDYVESIKSKKDKVSKKKKIEAKSKEKNIEKLVTKIYIQGKIGKDKVLSEDKLDCLSDDFCSVNLIGNIISGKAESFIWKINGEINKNIFSDNYSKLNPPYIKVPLGNHTISLETFSKSGEKYTSYFYIDVKASRDNKVEETSKEKYKATSILINLAQASSNDLKIKKEKSKDYYYLFLLILSTFFIYIVLKNRSEI